MRKVIDALSEILLACHAPEWADNCSLVLRTFVEQITSDKLRLLEAGSIFADFEDSALKRNYSRGQSFIIPRDTVIRFEAPRALNELIIADNLPDLLSIPSACRQLPKSYVLLHTGENKTVFGFVQGESLATAPLEVRRYHHTLNLWSVLEKKAAHIDTSDQSILFFGIRKTKILPGFAMTDLGEDLNTSEIIEFASTNDNSKTREEIFIAELSEFLRNTAPDKAFARLLRASRQFGQRLREGLNIYLTEHSPEKLASEAAAAALEQSGKLEGIISGIEVKSLAIPAALLLAVKDMQPGGGFTPLNSVILFACLTFSVTMHFVNQSQQGLIKVLKEEIKAKKRSFVEKGLEEQNEVIRVKFSELERRRDNACKASWAMFWFSFAPLVLGLLMAFCASPAKSPSGKADGNSASTTRSANIK